MMMAVPSQAMADSVDDNTKARLLVVDDEVFNRQLLSRILTPNYNVVQAGNGRETLELLALQSFDLILLDVMMPGMTGLEVVGYIRENPEWQDIPIILISALDQNENIVEGLHIGANDYIPKPFDIDVVSARISTQLKLKQALDIQKQAVEELTKAQAWKNQLLRIASHDLKSPLANVRMAEAILREIVGNEPTGVKVLDMLSMTVNTMNNVIVEFLDMAAIQSGAIEVHLEPLQISTVLNDVIAQFETGVEEKGITMNVGSLDGLVMADAMRLSQISANLISNAIKYTPPGSQVSIYTEVNEDSATIFIADQGAGIPANERDKLFTEFGKLTTRPTNGESSTGLGLWIVKQMVGLLHGEVDVECPADGGSIFWVKLPRA